MSYLGRVWMAASVAVVQGQTDGRYRSTNGAVSLRQNLRVFSGESTADLRPISTATINSDEQKQADESLRRVMYLNCWGQG